MTRFLENQVGEYGQDKVLLDADIDLSDNLGADGYTVVKAFSQEQFEGICDGVNAFVAAAVASALGQEAFAAAEAEHGAFCVDNYHLFVKDQTLHELVYSKIRHGIQISNEAPHPLGYSLWIGCSLLATSYHWPSCLRNTAVRA